MSFPTPDSTTPAGAHVALRETLLVLENLLQTLTEKTNSPQALRATVEAAREGVRAEVAFWHPKSGSRATVVAGEGPMTPDQFGHFARKLLAAVPTDLEVFRWVNPEPHSPDSPTAALVARTPRSGGCVVVITFTAAPNRAMASR